MRYIRLKSSLDRKHMEDRLKYNPEIIEIHLNEEDLYQPNHIVDNIQMLKSNGVRVYLHHPMTYQGQFLDLISSNQKMRDHYDWSCEILASICRQEEVKCVVHCHYVSSESTDFQDTVKRIEVRKRIESILSICEKSFLWEDTIRGIFSAENPYLLSEIIEPLNLPLTFDISHSFIALKGDNRRLQEHLEKLHHFAKYFHLVDSMGQKHDSLPLGKGKIEWQMVIPYVHEKDFIFEIGLKSSNHSDCTPMIESANCFTKIKSYTLSSYNKAGK